MQLQMIEERAAGMNLEYEGGVEARELPAFLQLKAAVAEFRGLEATFGKDEAANHHMVVSQVHALLAAILELENLGVDKEAIHTAVAEVLRLHAASPIIARMQNWPRGYAGDYQTVEIVLSGQCVSPKGTLAYHLERYVLDCPASQQHRNKVVAQAELIRSTIAANPDANILIVACGGCPDLKLLSRELKTFRGQLWLNDIDKDALERSTAQVARVCPDVKSVPGNVVELLRDAKSLPKFDLVVAGGLFDYLEDRVARFVIKCAYSCLRPSGRFFFTNIGKNPYRPWMEYCGEWFLRERDAASLNSLAIEAGVPTENVELSTETTGLTYLVEIAK